MCGIAGVIYADAARRPDHDDLAAMSAAIAHRGPDGEGFLVEPGVGLVHRRLAIVDLTGGVQPLGNEDGSVQVVFNGEIYNHERLRGPLEAAGHRFRTRSDTEALVHLYEEHDEEMVSRLRGMFAFAIWDRKRRRLLLVRDRVGIKPLYIYRDAEKLVFASELKAILAFPGVVPEVDPLALEDYLTFGYVPAPRSIFRGIEKLPPAHTLLLEHDRLTASPRRYWRLKFEPDERPTAEDWQAAVRAKFGETVQAHMMADVPVGAFLSGGVDSSAVVAAAGRSATGPLRTFSIGFADDEFSEAPFARAVAKQFGTVHTEQTFAPDAGELLDELTRYYDEPFADASSVPTYLVSRLAAKQVKVVLTGDGGDEAFGGYSRYAHDLKEAAVRDRLPRWFRRRVLGPAGGVWPQAAWLPRRLRAKSALTNLALDPAAAHAHSISRCRMPLRRRLLARDLAAGLNGHDPGLVVRQNYDTAPAGDPLAGMLAADVETLLPDDFLVKVDRASMAAGLEARPPLLDHELLELAARIPSRFKVRDGQTKWVFKQACRADLSADVLDRPKHGFDVPIADWLRGPLRERFLDTVLAPDGAARDLIDRAEVARLYDRHAKGAAGLGQVLWSVLVLAEWAGRYLKPARRRNPPALPATPSVTV